MCVVCVCVCDRERERFGVCIHVWCVWCIRSVYIDNYFLPPIYSKPAYEHH